MFAAIETALRTHLANTIAGVPVMGTRDTVDLSGEASPRIAMQVEYQGSAGLENRPQAVTFAHRFAAHIIVDAARGRDTEWTQAEAALSTVVTRLLAWTGTPRDVTIEQINGPQFDGQAQRMSVIFSLAPESITM